MLAGEQLELTLLRLVAGGGQALVRLLAGRGLLTAHDLAALVAGQFLARQTTLGVVRRAVENLRLAADRHHVATTDHTRLVRVVGGVINGVVVGCVVHPFLPEQQIFFRGGQGPPIITLGGNNSMFQPVLDLRRNRFWI